MITGNFEEHARNLSDEVSAPSAGQRLPTLATPLAQTPLP